MKVLITGASGYLGSILTEKLLNLGYECFTIDIIEGSKNQELKNQFIVDIRDDTKIQKIMDLNFDLVMHCVAQVPIAKNHQLFRSVNIDGTRILLENSLRTGVKKFVYISSSAVYGVPKSNPVTEDMLPEPLESYGQAKYEAELLCNKYSNSGLDISIIRPRTIIGKYRLGIFQILFEWVACGINLPVLGKGDNLYQFIHVDDLIDGCILAAHRKGSATYNLGAEDFSTMKEALQGLCDFANTGSRVKTVPFQLAVVLMNITSRLGLSPLGAYHALMYGRSMYFDISKSKSELNWQPKYSNLEMLTESYEWYLNNRKEVLSRKAGGNHVSPVNQGILKLLKFIF